MIKPSSSAFVGDRCHEEVLCTRQEYLTLNPSHKRIALGSTDTFVCVPVSCSSVSPRTPRFPEMLQWTVFSPIRPNSFRSLAAEFQSLPSQHRQQSQHHNALQKWHQQPNPQTPCLRRN